MLSLLFIYLDLQVGWQQTSYTMFEGGEVGEICMFARNEVSLESPATITVMDVETDAQGTVLFNLQPFYLFV